MRMVSRIAWVLAVAATSFAAAGCADDGGGAPDGGGGAGGSGGTGATGGSGGGQPTDGAIVDTGSLACPVTLPTACPTPPVTYAKVDPIFKARCSSVCHNGMTPDPNNNNEPIWGLTDYEHITSWQDTIRAAMANCSMPPADAGVPLTVEERTAILEWIRCGVPR